MSPLPKPLHDLFRPPPTPGVLGVFGHLDATVDAIKKLRAGGHTDFTVYSPIPRHEIEDALDQPVSPVRIFTLIGGIAGCAVGAWLTLGSILWNDGRIRMGGLTVLDWNCIVVVVGCIQTISVRLRNIMRALAHEGPSA